MRADGLRKRYGDVAAVAGIDMEIRRGEVFALLGPNGAGKTTTVEILEGYRRRDGGTVDGARRGSAAGRAGLAGPDRDRAPAGLPRRRSTELTVREMVRHFAGFYPRPKDPDEVIELVGLTAKARARMHQLSGGQVRRLDVALGIVGGPELLFLDEPTTGFDPEARRHFWDPDPRPVRPRHHDPAYHALPGRGRGPRGPGRGHLRRPDPSPPAPRVTWAAGATATATVSWQDGDRPAPGAQTDTPTRVVA